MLARLQFMIALALLAFGSAFAAVDDGDTLLRHARTTWSKRTEAPYVRYGVRIRFEEGARINETWYEATYRASDGALALTRNARRLP